MYEKSKGFTIVELLVVIVVIGILAAITVVSYTGISRRAVAASIQSDLSNASRKLELYRAEDPNNYYPDDPIGTGLIKFSNYTATPIYTHSSDYKTFTITAQKTTAGGTVVYKITNSANPVETPNEIYASGGTITDSGGYRIHTFTTTGNSIFTINNSSITTVQVLVVAGGGGGTSISANGSLGNAGAGGTVKNDNNYAVSPGVINVTVGAGGIGGVGNSAPTYTNGGNGGNSVFGTITATGGTGGLYTQAVGGSNANYNGGIGGSNYEGGGGAGGGGNGSTLNGGVGFTSSISVSSKNYAGGGGSCGWSYDIGNYCGTVVAGGGAGGYSSNGADGTVNTGGGGGAGSAYTPTVGGAGGSGIVIVRYAIP